MRTLCGAVLLLGCASTPSPVPRATDAVESVALSEPCPRSVALDVEAVTAEVTCLLQQYIRLDTTNPPGNEIVGARFLEHVLERNGIAAEVIESAPGRANLVARRKGQGEGKAVVLLHHIDVVPATADEWSVPPLSGELRDGFVWGRGALDNKGAGVMALVTFVMLHRLEIVLPRDVVLLAVADEESGGAQGARWLLDHRADLFEDVEFVLNEGGAILDTGGRALYNVELAQKAPLWLRVTAEGRSGHGAAPEPNAATHVLARALGRLAAHQFPIKVLPEVQAVFHARAAGMPSPAREEHMDLEASLENAAFRERFLADPRNAALVRNTHAITVLEGGNKENVVPPTASAVLDLRLLPGEHPEAVTAEIVRVMAEPSLRIETLLSWEAHASPRDTALFRAIESVAHARDPGAPVNANVIGGFTDCSAFRARGIVCYGFVPIRLDVDAFARIHGKDERVSVASLARAVVDLTALLQAIPAR